MISAPVTIKEYPGCAFSDHSDGLSCVCHATAGRWLFVSIAEIEVTFSTCGAQTKTHYNDECSQHVDGIAARETHQSRPLADLRGQT